MKDEKKWERNEKHTHTHTHTQREANWSMAKYSHRNLTRRLAAAPKSAVLHLKRCPLLFLGRDLLEEPQRERQEEDADSGSCFSCHTHTHSFCMTQLCSPNRKQSSADWCLCWHVNRRFRCVLLMRKVFITRDCMA